MEQDKKVDSVQENTPAADTPEETSHHTEEQGHHRSHHHHHHRHSHHHRARNEAEELLIFPDQETSSGDDEEDDDTVVPMARWQKILLIVLVSLCVIVCGTAAFLWVVGRPLMPETLADVHRLLYFGETVTLTLGLALLVGAILLTKRLWKRLLALLLSIFILLSSVPMLSWALWVGPLLVKPAVENVKTEEKLEKDKLEITPNLPAETKVQNIALFGIDQKKGSVGRSDAIMILSIDKTHNKVKLTSLDRDTLVPIDGHGEEKLTHAWAYGHAKLAVKTLNQNFGMNISEYMYVNFTEFVGAIDYLGGVTVDITEAEKNHLNSTYNPKYKYFGDYVPRITKTGRQRLNGTQALGYVRNRSDGTGRRASRHREVLSAMFAEVKKQSITQWPKTIGRLMQLCHTSLTVDEITDLVMWVLKEAPTTEELSLPTSALKAWGGVKSTAVGWVRVYDLKAATVVLHNFIYEKKKALPSTSTGDSTTEKEESKSSTKKKTTTTNKK